MEESFGLSWKGKSECMKVSLEPSQIFLEADCEESVDFDNTQNLFIEGDNLDVLKVFQASYLGQVKMIYIDPPYNTGKEFLYDDKYRDKLRGKKGLLHSNLRHSAWLNMMYPRLRLAWNLLREDGILFISIDDNEYANLKLVCDELFGVQSFFGNLVWRKRLSTLTSSNLSVDHEYVLSYKKSKFKKIRGIPKDYHRYSNPDNDPRGEWAWESCTLCRSPHKAPNQCYQVVDPKTGRVYPPPRHRAWRCIQETMLKLIQEGRVFFPKTPQGGLRYKKFKSELKSAFNPFSSWMSSSVNLNGEGTKHLQSLGLGNTFDYPKPPSLMATLLQQSTEGDDLVLDFFAGSCTLADAVMSLNAIDGGQRKYIMVQRPEPCREDWGALEKGYQTIADIGKDRIRRAADKIRQDHPEKAAQMDLGFKVFKARAPGS